MRRAGLFFLVVLTMGLLHRLTAAAPLPGRAVLALGFLVTASLVLGAWAETVKVPAVTAYVVTGFVLGPSWLGLIRGDEVAALGFTGDVVLAATALVAGTSLRLGALSLDRRSLLRFLGATALGPAACVALVMVALAHWFPPTAHEPFGDLLIVALVVGASAIASSPTLTIATTGAEQGFAQAMLGANVARDLLAAALFAVILIGAPLVSSPGAYDSHGALRPLGLLLGSVVGGVAVALGGVCLARIGGVASLLPPVLAGVAIALMARLLHLDPVFTGLMAGLCLIPWTREGPLARGLGGIFDTLRAPLFATAFGLLGAGIDLTDTSDLWGWVLVVAAARVVGLYAGGRWAARHEVRMDLARYGWVGLLSQSGLILWLAAAARHAFPEWGVSLQALIVGVVAVNAVLGPLALRRVTLLVGDSLQRSA